MVVRGGGYDPRWPSGVGAVWLYALEEPIEARIELKNTTLLDSTHAALLLMGKRIDGLSVDGLRVDHAAGHLLELRQDGDRSR
jgi:hypothetical protein